jgi:hypothetical protein
MPIKDAAVARRKAPACRKARTKTGLRLSARHPLRVGSFASPIPRGEEHGPDAETHRGEAFACRQRSFHDDVDSLQPARAVAAKARNAPEVRRTMSMTTMQIVIIVIILAILAGAADASN